MPPKRIIPLLEGWETVSQAASLLGVSRQYVHSLIGQDRFPTVRQVGPDTKPILLLRTREVLEMLDGRG